MAWPVPGTPKTQPLRATAQGACQGLCAAVVPSRLRGNVCSCGSSRCACIVQVVHDEAQPGQLSFYIDGAHTPESMESCAGWFAEATSLQVLGWPAFGGCRPERGAEAESVLHRSARRPHEQRMARLNTRSGCCCFPASRCLSAFADVSGQGAGDNFCCGCRSGTLRSFWAACRKRCRQGGPACSTHCLCRWTLHPSQCRFSEILQLTVYILQASSGRQAVCLQAPSSPKASSWAWPLAMQDAWSAGVRQHRFPAAQVGPSCCFCWPLLWRPHQQTALCTAGPAPSSASTAGCVRSASAEQPRRRSGAQHRLSCQVAAVLCAQPAEPAPAGALLGRRGRPVCCRLRQGLQLVLAVQVLVTGSLYLVGDSLRHLGRMPV